MSSTVNASIPLQFQPTQFPGFDMGRAAQAANQIVGLQQAQQQQKSQNALRGILGAPGAVDPTTGQPTPAALQQVMAVDPAAGMKLQQNALMMQQNQLRTDAMKSDLYAKNADTIEKAYLPIQSTYEENIKAGMPPEQAASLATTALASANDQLSKIGAIPPSRISTLPRSYDPIQFKQGLMGFDEYRNWRKDQGAAAKVQADEARENAKLNETIHHNRAVEGRGDFANPTEVEYKGPDGKPVRVLAQQDKATGAWMTADQDRKPLPGGVAIVKPPVPGSQAAIGEAIASDLETDPDWKDKTPGERGAEVIRRIKIASGQLTDPAARHEMAQEIASYQLQPLSGFALTKPGGPETMAEVLKINPDYQGARYPEVSKAMSAFGSGSQGNIIRSLNVATQHLETIDSAAEALKNGNVRSFNSIGNSIAKEFGVAAPTTFDGLKQIVGTEIEKAVAGGIGASADRDRLMKALDSANSPAQLMEVSNSFKKLMAGQAMGLRQQYEDATGFKTGPFSFDQKLMPATKKALGMVKAEEGDGKSQPGAAGSQTTAKGNQDALWKPGMEIPAGAIAHLKAQPNTAAAFDKHFGAGAAQKYLGQQGGTPTGGPPPAAPASPAAPAQATAPAIPAPPAGIPPGSAYSPSRKMWRDPSGKIYDASGKPVAGP